MTDDVPAFDPLTPPGVPAWEWGEDLCAPFVSLLPVSGASICVVHGQTGHWTVCASDPLAARLDTLQFELGEGPQWLVARSRRPVVSADVVHDASPDWPVFGSAVVALGVGALFAFPITIGAVMIGVVDLYRRTPGSLDRRATAQALALARSVAAPAVREALRSVRADRAAGPARAPALRREVHQAVGMVLVQMDVSPAEALDLLRARAFATTRTLEEVARDVVEGRIDFRHLPG